eukprot:93176_1
MSTTTNQQDKPIIHPPKSKQHALIAGYIRESTTNYSFTLPICIIKLCLSFFNTIQYFKFEKETLKKFLNSSKDDIWEGKPFNRHGIIFQFVLSPNGLSPGQIGFFVKVIKVKYLSSFHKVVIKATLFCHETETFYTNTKQGVFKIGTDRMISISDCKDKKCLTFSGNIEILQINYEQRISKPVWTCANTQMRSSNICTWIIHRKELEKQLYFGKYIDNRHWVVFYETETFYLRLLDLPTDVISVCVKLKTKYECYNGNEMVREKILQFDYVFTLATNTRNLGSHLSVSCNVRIGKNRKQFEKVVIYLELEVYGICKRNCISIDKCDW